MIYKEVVMDKKNIIVSAEDTPNPQSLKFSLNQIIADEKWEVENISEAGRSPLAQKILGFPWATKVFIGENFVTVNKEDWVDWDVITQPLSQMIQEHIAEGQAVLYPPAPAEGNPSAEDSAEHEKTSPTIIKIKELLAKDIQPAVAMDGGFIAFAGYENGTVFLRLQGACAGCPSSSITLKQGIENHLKSHIPEIKEVVAV